MYNSNSIAVFIDKVNKDAAQAAQMVYDANKAELIKRIQAQMHKDDALYIRMGSSYLQRNGQTLENKFDEFTWTITQTQYQQEDYYSGFDLPDMITKL